VSFRPCEEPECNQGAGRSAELVITAGPRDIGALTVRRALPAMQRRLVGPFIFWDHMGLVTFEPGAGIDVRPHPHIGLATLTYLFDGEIVHKDSLGSDQSIRPGAVNWMTAGRGIVHSERTGPELRRHGSRLHGIQSWVALRRELEEMEPAFFHHAKGTIPETSRAGVRLRIVAGTAYGETSPVKVLSPLFYVEALLDAGASLAVPLEHEERAAYVAEGSVACEREAYHPGQLVILRPGTEAVLKALEPGRVMLFGGAPLEGRRHIFWNFVSSSEERIERAKRDWSEDRFPKVPGDDLERIPLPSENTRRCTRWSEGSAGWSRSGSVTSPR
jgi:redox-sensitive bicupin YhaK (pirin superfamily)